MLNPSSLRITLQGKDVQNISPFVGIRKAIDGQMEFCLPFGFDDFPVDDSQEITKFFFDLYKAFQHFQLYVEDNFERKSPNTDGSIKKDGGFTFVTKDNESVTLCAKISNLESVLAAYDEPRIFSIVKRPKRTSRLDYAQIGKYLHQAVFLANHSPYVDEMVLPQPFIEYTITDLVRMYCYVYVEIEQQLNEHDLIPTEIKNQAQIFREYNLQPDSSLFSPNHDFTIQLLRSALNDIHRQESLKDEEYWHFYQALEDFLYGVPNFTNNGIFWGITSFSLVWEDMCLVYLRGQDWNGVWYADSPRFANTKISGYKIFLKSNFESPFCFRLNEESRYLRPDLVRIYQFDSTDWFEETFFIKFLNSSSCQIKLKKAHSPNNKRIFEDLNQRIKTKFAGTRSKPGSAVEHVYKAITKSGIEKIIEDVKTKRCQLESDDTQHHLIVDFKYFNSNAYTQPRLSRKIVYDIDKQSVYECAVSLNAPNSIAVVKSQFVVPHYFQIPIKNRSRLRMEAMGTERNRFLIEREIEVLRVDYLSIQKFYNSYLST